MRDLSDMTLLREYARLNSEAAFAELVQRHVSLVYSAACRHTGQTAQAEEITQAVFIILARKADKLSPHTVLAGWLCETTRLTALSFQRGERRRQFREQEAYMQSTLQEPDGPAAWRQLSPMLDEALARLGQKERDAVVLRFFKGQDLCEVATALKITEPAAQRRVHRAVEKLRKFFTKRGVNSTSEIITGAISANAVQAAPVALAKTVTAIAVAKGAAASTSTLPLIKGALKIMTWTKMKTAIVIGVCLLMAAGTATITVEEIEQHWTYPWQDMVTGNAQAQKALDTTPPQVRIVRSKFAVDQPHPRFYDDLGSPNRWRCIYTHITPEEIVRAAYFDYTTHINNDFPFLGVSPPNLPGGFYDCIANLPSGSHEALQQLVRKKFGLVGKYEMRDLDVLRLQIDRTGAPGLKPGTPPPPGPRPPSRIINGIVYYKNRSMSELAAILEQRLEFPVVDETGLTGNYDLDVPSEFGGPNVPGKTGASPQRIEGARAWLQNELGLKLVPNRQPHEVFVIEKVK